MGELSREIGNCQTILKTLLRLVHELIEAPGYKRKLPEGNHWILPASGFDCTVRWKDKL